MILQTLLSNPAVQALGIALLHFVWQGFLLALLLWLFQVLMPGASARLRYAAGCAVLLAMPVMLLLTPVVRNRPATSAAVIPSTPLSTTSAVFTESNGAPPRAVRNGVGLAGWAVALWLVGIFALSLQSSVGWIRAQRLKHRGTAPPEPYWTAMLEQLMRRLEVSRPVRLCTSAIAEVPTVVGWMRPFILLPVSALSGLDPSQIEAILAHELAHIRRHDYLVNLLQTAIETLLFYHPAVWWVSRQIRREREHCCDDMAVAVCGDVKLYAGALAQLEELRGRAPSPCTSEPALAATGGELLGRIRRLLQPAPSGRRIPRFLGTAMAAALVLGAIGVPAVLLLNAAPQQPPPAPAPPRDQVQTVEAGPPVSPSAVKRLAIPRDLRVSFQDAEHLFRGIQIEQGKFIQELSEPKRAQSEAGTDTLIKLYDSSKDPDIKRSVLGYLAERDGAKAAEKIRSVAQSDTDPEMRRDAVGYLAERATSYEQIVSLFESARDPEMRRTVLDHLAAFSDPRVLDKLLAIAQSDADPDIRRSAVDYIAER